jgi:predicted extracellular nuclease
MLDPTLVTLLVLAASAGSAFAAPLGQVTLEVPGQLAERTWLAPHEIQGASWLSKYDKQRVDVEGIVTARSCVRPTSLLLWRGFAVVRPADLTTVVSSTFGCRPYGFYIQSVQFDDDDATSEGLYVRPSRASLDTPTMQKGAREEAGELGQRGGERDGAGG